MPKSLKFTLIFTLILLASGQVFAAKGQILTHDRALAAQDGQDTIQRSSPDKNTEEATGLAKYMEGAINDAQNAGKSVKKFLSDFWHTVGEIKDFIYSLMKIFYKKLYP